MHNFKWPIAITGVTTPLSHEGCIEFTSSFSWFLFNWEYF